MEFKQLWHVSVYFQENFNLTMMISIQRLQRTSPWSKICASRGFESVKPRCLLKICFRRTCLFAPEIWSSGAHQTPTIGGTRVESSSGFGGNGEIPWDPPGKVWKPRIFDKNCRKCHNLLGQVFFFFFQMSGFPTFKPKRVAMLAESSCHEFPVQAKVPVSG